jgi:4-diphosphocytidyl-2-C-methyl-D-erythritol kinase
MAVLTAKLDACAKINLWLRVLGRREDGFHEVETRMLRLSLADVVSLEWDAAAVDEVLLSCSDGGVPCDESNLALRALRAFQARTGAAGGGWRIHLEKRIPVGAGLGGGSSDAAAVLRGVNAFCGGLLSEDELVSLGGELGADVAFFVRDCVAADASGKGEVVKLVSWTERLCLVLVKPPFGVATPWAYGRWADSRELPGVLYAPQLTVFGALENDLERPVFEKYPLLAVTKAWLLRQKECVAALMSGSGATVFGVARNARDAQDLAGQAAGYLGEKSWVEVVECAVEG